MLKNIYKKRRALINPKNDRLLLPSLSEPVLSLSCGSIPNTSRSEEGKNKREGKEKVCLSGGRLEDGGFILGCFFSSIVMMARESFGRLLQSSLDLPFS